MAPLLIMLMIILALERFVLQMSKMQLLFNYKNIILIQCHPDTIVPKKNKKRFPILLVPFFSKHLVAIFEEFWHNELPWVGLQRWSALKNLTKRLILDKEGWSDHPFRLNIERHIHCMDVNEGHARIVWNNYPTCSFSTMGIPLSYLIHYAPLHENSQDFPRVSQRFIILFMENVGKWRDLYSSST